MGIPEEILISDETQIVNDLIPSYHHVDCLNVFTIILHWLNYHMK